MNRTLRRELYWFLGGIVLLLIVLYLNTGSFNPFSDSALDINIHDTYLVIAGSHFSLLLFPFIFFDIYLIRALFSKFKNKTINILFLVFNGLMILSITQLLIFWWSFSEFGNSIDYPPLSGVEETQPNFFAQFYFIPVLMLAALIVTQTVIAIKTGKMINTKD